MTPERLSAEEFDRSLILIGVIALLITCVGLYLLQP